MRVRLQRAISVFFLILATRAHGRALFRILPLPGTRVGAFAGFRFYLVRYNFVVRRADAKSGSHTRP